MVFPNVFVNPVEPTVMLFVEKLVIPFVKLFTNAPLFRFVARTKMLGVVDAPNVKAEALLAPRKIGLRDTLPALTVPLLTC